MQQQPKTTSTVVRRVEKAVDISAELRSKSDRADGKGGPKGPIRALKDSDSAQERSSKAGIGKTSGTQEE
eukprot:IDg21503t1